MAHFILGLKKLRFNKYLNLIILFFFIGNNISFSQEICNNGIDDDGDGLIDLNDILDCTCSSSINIPSLIPNPSFENQNCAPVVPAQMNCASDWVQATTATSDYFNTTFNNPNSMENGIIPPPDGTGYVGGVVNHGWIEYIGSCLNEPMAQSTTYMLNFNILSIYNFYTGQANSTTSPPPTNIAIYGSSTCNFPLPTTYCPVGNGDWQLLGTTLTTGNSGWQTLSIEFTPSSTINSIILGPACGSLPTLPHDGLFTEILYDYHYYDNLILNIESAFTTSNINSSGNWCTNNLILFANPTEGATYQWFRSGIAISGETTVNLNLSANNYQPGEYSFVTYMNGDCSRSDITIDPPTIVNPIITEVAPLCSGNILLNLESNVTNGIWSGNGIMNTETGTFNPYLAGAGRHEIIFNQTGICSGADTIEIIVYAEPDANFSSPNVCEGNSTVFTDQSIMATPEFITNWDWTFSDGLTSTLQNPTHSFNNDGIYANKLVITTNNGCKDSITLNTTSWPLPIPSFVLSNSCANSQSSFSNSSTISSVNTINSVSSCTWDFGDGENSTLFSPFHQYGTSGIFNVSMTATSQNGCFSTLDSVILINSSPIANFNGSPVCLRNETSFIDNSTAAIPDIITSWQWIFGDGSISNIQNPTHLFTNENIYSNTLIITTNQGCSDTIVNTNIIWPLPEPDFAFENGEIFEETTFTNTTTINSSITQNSIADYLWNFGDGTYSSEISPVHAFSEDEIVNVSLIAISLNGCIDSIQKKIRIKGFVNFWIPNSFTPNGNEFNNQWKPIFSSGIDETSIQLTIYNRWGEKIWHCTTIDESWDGFYKNQQVPEGTYTWVLDYKLKDLDEYKSSVGHLNIIR